MYDDFGTDQSDSDFGHDNFDNAFDHGYLGLTQSGFDDPSRCTEISMPLSRYGYGYSCSGSKLIYVAVVILLIHVAVYFIHIIWIAVTDPPVDLSWDTLSELTAVLLRSPNAERGVPLLKTNLNWKDRIVVRETGDEDKPPSDINVGASDTKLVAQRPSILMLRRVPAGSNKAGQMAATAVNKESEFSPVIATQRSESGFSRNPN